MPGHIASLPKPRLQHEPASGGCQPAGSGDFAFTDFDREAFIREQEDK
jgi:hypothetical protein